MLSEAHLCRKLNEEKNSPFALFLFQQKFVRAPNISFVWPSVCLSSLVVSSFVWFLQHSQIAQLAELPTTSWKVVGLISRGVFVCERDRLHYLWKNTFCCFKDRSGQWLAKNGFILVMTYTRTQRILITQYWFRYTLVSHFSKLVNS